MTEHDHECREVDDRTDIHELVLRYCRAVDRGDYDAVRDVYAPEGIDRHTGFDGPADEYVAWLRTKLPSFDGTMHIVANHTVEFLGDRALAETYGTAVHWGTPTTDAALNFTSGFRYIDHVRRTDRGWRIVERRAVREWTRSDAGRLVAPEAAGPRGTRDHRDPLHAMRELVTAAGR